MCGNFSAASPEGFTRGSSANETFQLVILSQVVMI